MKNNYRNHLLLLSCLLPAWLCAQTVVFPGDANANGTVDQYDIPYIGYGIGSTGPARILTEDDASSQPIAALWNDDFPSGLNLIHADVDGNGLVDLLDFFLWNENFGLTHDLVTPVSLSPNVPDAPAVVRWNNNEMLLPLTGGGTAELPIDILLSNDFAVNGMAFRLRYNPTHFNAVFFSTVDNWLKADNNGISLQNTSLGVVDVGMSRLGNDPVNGGGTCGTMSLIIIDDMIDLLETAPDTMSTWIKLEGLQLLDGELDPIPVRVDSFELKLYRPGTLAATTALRNDLAAKVFPNPAAGPFIISAGEPFIRLAVVDAWGRTLYQSNFLPQRRWEWTQPPLPAGMYHLRLEGEDGVSYLRWVQL